MTKRWVINLFKNADSSAYNVSLLNIRNCLWYIKDEYIKFKTIGSTEIEKCKFKYFKYPINISSVSIDNIIVSGKVSLGKNCFK